MRVGQKQAVSQNRVEAPVTTKATKVKAEATQAAPASQASRPSGAAVARQIGTPASTSTKSTGNVEGKGAIGAQLRARATEAPFALDLKGGSIGLS